MSNHVDLSINSWNAGSIKLSGQAEGQRTESSFQQYMEKSRGDISPVPLEKLTPEAINALAANLISMLDRASMHVLFSESGANTNRLPSSHFTTDMFVAMRNNALTSVTTELPEKAVEVRMESKPVPVENELSPDKNRVEVDAIIARAAEAHGVDAKLIEAVIKTESDFNPDAVSPVGAQGLMQLMPGTAEDLGVKDPFDAEENVQAGSRYLKQLLDRYDGDTGLALAAYNWGMGNLERHPERMPQETINYISKINGLLNQAA